MTYASLLNQTGTLYPKAIYNKMGRVQTSTGVSVRCRFQQKTVRKLMANGQVLTIEAIAYLPADSTVATDDRFDYGSSKFKVVSKYEGVGGSGNVENIKIELIKWQET